MATEETVGTEGTEAAASKAKVKKAKAAKVDLASEPREQITEAEQALYKLGEQGVVRLKVLVDEQGRPKDIEVARSSGYPRLDQQAVQAMKKARFQPHLEDGQARSVWVLAPLTFNLED